MQRPPSIVFLNRFYWPDLAATAQQLTDLAEDLAASGMDVTVIASRGEYEEAGGELPLRECRNGVRILRLPTTRFGRARLVGRAMDYATYMAGAALRLLRIPKPDVVVACTDPPFILAPAILSARLRNFDVIYNVRDLYPHLAAKLGVFDEDGAVSRLLHACARRLHAASDAVITLGPRMAREMGASGAPPERTSYIPDGVDARAIEPIAPEQNPLLAELGLEDKFVVLYSGNAGRAHTFNAVLEAARRLRSDPEIVFLFIGGGSKRPRLEAAVRSRDLCNVRFMEYLPREQLRFSLSMADVSLVTESPEVAGLLVPCKTYGILASGRPLVFVGSEQSDVAEIVRTSGCGFVVHPDDAAGLTTAIRRLKNAPAERAALGRRSRRAAETVYDRSTVAEQWREHLSGLIEIAPSAERARASDVGDRRPSLVAGSDSE